MKHIPAEEATQDADGRPALSGVLRAGGTFQ